MEGVLEDGEVEQRRGTGEIKQNQNLCSLFLRTGQKPIFIPRSSQKVF